MALCKCDYCYYSVPVGVRSIVINPSVCLSVCLVCPRAYLWNRWTDLHEFFAQMPCGRGSVLLWRRCAPATLSTSGFMDDVTFGRNGPYGDSGVAIPGRSLMSTNALLLLGQGHVTGSEKVIDQVSQGVTTARSYRPNDTISD